MTNSSKQYSPPLLSVWMITYQHANYIRDALDGVLMQQTDFPFKICIGEDGSDDGTREICQEYAERHPDIIRLFLRDREGDERKKYTAPFMFNMVETLRACEGKYIALCEGDDYWTDPLKLQKQVEFLENNEDFAITHHKTDLLKNGKIQSDELNINTPEVTTITDLAKGNYIRTLSVLFRNPQSKSFFITLPNCPIGDFPLYLAVLNYFQCKIRYFPETMGVYRLHKQGVYENKSSECKSNTFGETIENLIDSSILEQYEVVHILKNKHHNIYWKLYEKEKDEIKRLYYLQKSVKYSNKNIKELQKTVDDIQSNSFFKIYRKTKKILTILPKKI
nr:glycosyltransferase [uncultured Desulfobacter sp.]